MRNKSITRFFLIVFLAYCLNQRILTPKKSLFIISLFSGTIVLLSYAFPTNILSYLRNGLDIINGYSQAMYLQRTDYFEFMDLDKGVACIVILVIPFLVYFKKIWADKRTLMLYLFVFCFAFILFKKRLDCFFPVNFFCHFIFKLDVVQHSFAFPFVPDKPFLW